DYDRIQQECRNKLDEVKSQREQQIKEAEQKMKAVLTSEQWTKFEQIKRDRGMPMGGHGRGPRGPSSSATGPWAGHGPADGPPPGPPPGDAPGNRDSKDRP